LIGGRFAMAPATHSPSMFRRIKREASDRSLPAKTDIRLGDPHDTVVILTGGIGDLREDHSDARIVGQRRLPKAVIGCATMASTCASSAKLQWMAPRDLGRSVHPPRARTALSFQSASATEAPDSAKAFAVARPSPEAAPVIGNTASYGSEATLGDRRVRMSLSPGASPANCRFRRF
jgi:hypothetical protein